MDYVTFETAMRLKKAGFPQPAMGFGQIWYIGDDQTRLCAFSENDLSHFYENKKSDFLTIQSCDFTYAPNVCFAPTATDILKELGDDFILKVWDAQFDICEIISGGKDWMEMEVRHSHENPAEAGAAMFLELNEKKN